MSLKERQEKFGDQKWSLVQTQDGGRDTVPTDQYPKILKEEALVAQAKEKTKPTEPEESQESNKQDSTYWENQHDTPGSSSTNWNEDPWHGWHETREDHQQWQAEEWHEDDQNQWKRQKWW